MAQKYDEEIYEYYTIQMFDSNDVAENGATGNLVYRECKHSPSLESLEKEAKKYGYDTFEITKVLAKVERYSVN